jgi:hypothetical protein
LWNRKKHEKHEEAPERGSGGGAEVAGGGGISGDVVRPRTASLETYGAYRRI